MSNKKGITLTSLVITMIILIILAGVGIGTLRPGGLVDKAEEAKKQAQIENEKEIVGTSVVQTAYANRYGNIERDELAVYVEKNAGDRDVEVIEDGNKIYVNFKDTERYYEVGDDGEVSNPIIKEEIEYAGDITKGGTCDGSEEKPYEINCIEDLVAFSIMSNGGNTELGLSSNYFVNKYVILKRTLDFNSMFSYNNTEEIKYGDLNTDGIVESIRTELTKTAEGCIGFTPISNFKGNFDGRGYEIKNVYIKIEDNVRVGGLFATIGGDALTTTVKNISMTGNVTGIGSIGGIVGFVNHMQGAVLIENCINKCTLQYNLNPSGVVICGVGGILGENSHANQANSVQIINCKNYGTVNSISENYYTGVGGIVGCDYYNGLIINKCYNEGIINGYEFNSAGIIGRGGNTIINSCNKGKVKGSGIGGDNVGSIYNCYNIGETTVSGIAKGSYLQSVVINNVYTTSLLGNKPIVYANITSSTSNISNAFFSEQCIYNDIYGTAISEERMTSNEQNEDSLISILNSYVQTYNEENINSENYIELSYWIIDSKSGYPILQ